YYMTWNFQYAALLGASTVFNFVMARAIGRSTVEKQQKRLLFAAVAINLLVLAVFKYFNFFSDAVAGLFSRFAIDYTTAHLDFLLPVGISFYTFMEIGYVVDVFRKKIKPEQRLGIFATFVAFFPQLVSGPIGRAPALLPQFKEDKFLEDNRIVE